MVTVTSLMLAAAVAERERAEAQQAQLYQEAQEARATAEESLALLDTLLATAPVGFAFMDLGSALSAGLTRPLPRSTGSPRTAHLGRTMPEVLPTLAPLVEPLHRQVLQTGQPLVNVELSGQKPTDPSGAGPLVGKLLSCPHP